MINQRSAIRHRVIPFPLACNSIAAVAFENSVLDHELGCTCHALGRVRRASFREAPAAILNLSQQA
jgi:hypothetical protein